MFTPSLFHALRGSTESHNLRVSVFHNFFTVLFPQKFHWLFSTLQQKIASTHENHYRVSKGLIKSLRLTECLPMLYIPLLCVLGVKCFPTATLVRSACWDVESVFCALWYLYFLQIRQTRGAEIAICDSWQQLLTVVNSPWASKGPKVLSSIFLIVSEFCHQLKPITRNPFFSRHQ